MPRVKLNELPSYEYHHVLTVRATDINYAGHLGNEALLELIHEARAQFMQRLSFDTIVSDDQPIGLIIADMAVNFKAEAFAKDKLTIDCQIGDLGERSLRFFHRIRRGNEVIALVESGAMAYDYQANQVILLPKEFLNELKNYRAK